MHDPIWFRQFEQEYNEREERLAEIRQKHKEFVEANTASSANRSTDSADSFCKPKTAANDTARSAWRKRFIDPGY